MTDTKNLLTSSLGMVAHNKRYILWFWILNLTLAEFGVSPFRQSSHAILDHSLVADRLVHGFDLAVFGELLARPEFGPMGSATMPALFFGFLFFLATALFLPGVFAGYDSTYRLPRADFFRACGRNLWRFIRIMIIAGIIMGIIAGVLFAISGAIVKKADESTSEVLPFKLKMLNLALIFLVMTALRIWFDLAEVDTVLNDQPAVRKSIAAAFRHAFGNIFRLLASYVLITIVAAVILLAGIWTWMKIAPDNVAAAFVISQITLLLLLIPRFWQRGVAVSYWQQWMLKPVVAPVSVAPLTPAPVVIMPEPSPAIPQTEPPTQS